MPYPHDIVCVSCLASLRIETQGVVVIEMASFGPYKVWNADLYKCAGCGAEMVTGFGQFPIRADHYAPDFAEWLETVKSHAPKVIYEYEKPNKITVTIRQSKN